MWLETVVVGGSGIKISGCQVLSVCFNYNLENDFSKTMTFQFTMQIIAEPIKFHLT